MSEIYILQTHDMQPVKRVFIAKKNLELKGLEYQVILFSRIAHSSFCLFSIVRSSIFIRFSYSASCIYLCMSKLNCDVTFIFDSFKETPQNLGFDQIKYIFTNISLANTSTLFSQKTFENLKINSI